MVEKEKPTVGSPFFGEFQSVILRQRRVSIYNYLFTVAIPINYTIIFREFLKILRVYIYIYIYIYIYRMSQEECARLREGVPYVKVYRYNPKHLYPKLNGYGDNGQ